MAREAKIVRRDESTPWYCSMCRDCSPGHLVQINGHWPPPREFARFCGTCVGILSRDRKPGKETRAKLRGGQRLTSKRYCPKAESATEPCTLCGETRGERLAMWLGQSCEVICLECVTALSAPIVARMS